MSLIVLVKDLQRHQLRRPTDSGDALAIVPRGRDNARHVSTVTVVIQRITVTVAEVVAVKVIDEPIPIVIDAVACDLAGFVQMFAAKSGCV